MPCILATPFTHQACAWHASRAMACSSQAPPLAGSPPPSGCPSCCSCCPASAAVRASAADLRARYDGFIKGEAPHPYLMMREGLCAPSISCRCAWPRSTAHRNRSVRLAGWPNKKTSPLLHTSTHCAWASSPASCSFDWHPAMAPRASCEKAEMVQESCRNTHCPGCARLPYDSIQPTLSLSPATRGGADPAGNRVRSTPWSC